MKNFIAITAALTLSLSSLTAQLAHVNLGTGNVSLHNWNNSITVGNNNIADGYGVAVGYNNIAGNMSISIGNGAYTDLPSWYNLSDLTTYFGVTEIDPEWSFAVGAEEGSYALHYEAIAMMSSSYALASQSLAIGQSTFSLARGSKSLGSWLYNDSAYSIALGQGNKIQSNQNRDEWVETDTLFSLGNHSMPRSDPRFSWKAPAGSGSNAITTLKNGRTTLTNKFWDATTPDTVPADTDASSGDALLVEGHSKLLGNLDVQGTIRIEPQGDLSMGPFTAE